jgi:hypothetical protein
MRLRFTLMPADPLRLGEAVHYPEHGGRTLVEDELGNVGMSLKVIAVVETFWVSGNATRESDKNVRSTATPPLTARRQDSVESYRVASIVKLGPRERGNAVRVTNADADCLMRTRWSPVTRTRHSRGSRDRRFPWRTPHRARAGQSLVSETMWTDEAALTESRRIDAASGSTP